MSLRRKKCSILMKKNLSSFLREDIIGRHLKDQTIFCDQREKATGPFHLELNLSTFECTYKGSSINDVTKFLTIFLPPSTVTF